MVSRISAVLLAKLTAIGLCYAIPSESYAWTKAPFKAGPGKSHIPFEDGSTRTNGPVGRVAEASSGLGAERQVASQR